MRKTLAHLKATGMGALAVAGILYMGFGFVYGEYRMYKKFGLAGTFSPMAQIYVVWYSVSWPYYLTEHQLEELDPGNDNRVPLEGEEQDPPAPAGVVVPAGERISPEDEELRQLIHRAVITCQEAQPRNRCLALAKECRKEAAAKVGVDHLDYAACANLEGVALGHFGDYVKAVHLLEDALRIRRKELGDSHVEVASSLGNLGRIHWFNGNLERAEINLRKGLAILRSSGADSPTLAATLFNLADLCMSQGNLVEAHSLFEESALAAEQGARQTSSEAGAALTGMGKVELQQGQLEAAEKHFRQAMAEFSRHLGDGHEYVYQARGAVGEVQLARGNYPVARTNLAEAVKGLEDSVVVLAAEKGRLLRSLGEAEIKLGLTEEAGRHFDRAVELARRDGGYLSKVMLGNVLVRKGDLALYHIGDLDAAEKAYTQAKAVLIDELGQKSSTEGTIFNGLAEVAATGGEIDKAIEYFGKALESFEATSGLKHEQVATLLSHRGRLWASKGRVEAAERDYSEALTIAEETVGDKHPIAAVAMGGLGILKLGAGNPAKARELLTTASAILEEHLGAEHPTAVHVNAGLAACMFVQGDEHSAKKLVERHREHLETALDEK